MTELILVYSKINILQLSYNTVRAQLGRNLCSTVGGCVCFSLKLIYNDTICVGLNAICHMCNVFIIGLRWKKTKQKENNDYT